MNSNLYIGEACGTCAHSDVCIHRVRGDNTIALHMAEEVEPNLPAPFKIRLFCAKYQSNYKSHN